MGFKSWQTRHVKNVLETDDLAKLFITAEEASMCASARSFSPGRLLLNLDGVECGSVNSATGGDITADVISEFVGPFVMKHLGSRKIEDLEMQIGLSMDKSVYDWIAAMWAAHHQRKNGSIIYTDFKDEVLNEREFFEAWLVEVSIPAMDVASKKSCVMTLRCSPQKTRDKEGEGRKVIAWSRAPQKKWRSYNFRLQIDGLDCIRVKRIDSFNVKASFVTEPVGERRDFEQELARLDFSNLKITLAGSAAQLWFEWHEDFVIKGNNDRSKEKAGTLTFLARDQTELAHINFFNLGIFKLTIIDDIRDITAELYCGRMEFAYKEYL